jgi:transcriptional regulator of acetoin/glycerol metabolism
LNQWVREASGQVWVVSTAVQSLLPLVEAGDFNDELYYRLNPVMIDLTSPIAQ